MGLLLLLGPRGAGAQEDGVDFRLLTRDPLRTVVTGRGEDASVAWPDGPAALTPLWMTARLEVGWTCGGGKALQLEAKAVGGPVGRGISLPLSSKPEGTTTVELYLWKLSTLKAACVRPRLATVDSLSVLLSLHCQKGRAPLQVIRSIPLQVQCKPAASSMAAVTGISGSERIRRAKGSRGLLPKFGILEPDVSPGKPRLNKAQTLHFDFVPIERFEPEIVALRVVRLDAAGQVVETSKPIARSRDDEGREGFLPRLSHTPSTPGAVRVALEAEYADGSRLRSRPDELWVEDPKAKQEPASSRGHLLEAFGKQHPGEPFCSRQGVWWLRRQPWVEEASSTGHDLSYKTRGGVISLYPCHAGH